MVSVLDAEPLLGAVVAANADESAALQTAVGEPLELALDEPSVSGAVLRVYPGVLE